MDSSPHHPTVELIFTKCLLAYGRDFLARWNGLEVDSVKSDWQHELATLLDNHGAIKHALTNLPEKPPTVAQFRSLCINRPPAPTLALPRPSPTAAEKAKVREAMARVTARLKANSAKPNHTRVAPPAEKVPDLAPLRMDGRSLLQQLQGRIGGGAQ